MPCGVGEGTRARGGGSKGFGSGGVGGRGTGPRDGANEGFGCGGVGGRGTAPELVGGGQGGRPSAWLQEKVWAGRRGWMAVRKKGEGWGLVQRMARGARGP